MAQGSGGVNKKRKHRYGPFAIPHTGGLFDSPGHQPVRFLFFKWFKMAMRGNSQVLYKLRIAPTVVRSLLFLFAVSRMML